MQAGFLMEYLQRGILPENPFESIDANGVGKLMGIGVKLGRGQRHDLEVGICGEHGGDQRAFRFAKAGPEPSLARRSVSRLRVWRQPAALQADEA